MTKKFKVYSNKTETRIVLESMTAGATGSANIASAPQGQKLVQSRNMEAKDKVPQKPRQGPLRPQTGGGSHRDKKKEQRQGKEKHRKPFMEDDISKKRDLLLTLKDVNPTLETNYLELASVNELEDMLFQWADETEQKLRELEQQAKTSKVAKQKFQELKDKWDMVQQKLYGISEQDMAEGLSKQARAKKEAESVKSAIARLEQELKDPNPHIDKDDIRRRLETEKRRLELYSDVLDEQGVAEGSDTDLSPDNIAALLYNVSHYGDGQEGEIRDHAISLLARKFNNRQKATDLIDKTDLGDKVVQAYHELRRQGVKENHADHEISMSRSELYTIVKQATELFKLLAQRSEMEGLEAWQQSKITKAADYLNAVHRSVNYDEQYGDDDQSGVAEGDYRNPRYHQVYGDPGENTPDETYIVKKFYFNVPFDQKDTAKLLKMMWDRDLKKWYLPKWSTSGIKFEQRLMSAKAAFGEPLDIKGSMEEDKIKGVDGKACWKGKRYAGREKKADGTYKDICKEDSYLGHLDSILNEKMASQQQSKLMHAAANDPAVAKKTRVSQKVAREFVKASHGQKVSKLPKRVKKSK